MIRPGGLTMGGAAWPATGATWRTRSRLYMLRSHVFTMLGRDSSARADLEAAARLRRVHRSSGRIVAQMILPDGRTMIGQNRARPENLPGWKRDAHTPPGHLPPARVTGLARGPEAS